MKGCLPAATSEEKTKRKSSFWQLQAWTTHWFHCSGLPFLASKQEEMRKKLLEEMTLELNPERRQSKKHINSARSGVRPETCSSRKYLAVWSISRPGPESPGRKRSRAGAGKARGPHQKPGTLFAIILSLSPGVDQIPICKPYLLIHSFIFLLKYSFNKHLLHTYC